MYGKKFDNRNGIFNSISIPPSNSRPCNSDSIPELELKAIPTLELAPTQGDRASADTEFDVMLFQICYITALSA